ncbi:hypothetical protein TIFTF001_008445 [Ficus carica]|uniref:Uncharacterized protein n=1 Tax=Ficus carica TaxID=3494 RepID=A0AA88D2U6_FICCA|nr:hypothetical protein TIFTF001_008445 [Ficus carica]
MCNQKYYGEERAPTFLRLRLLMGKLQKHLSLLAAAKECDFEEEVLEVPTTVPDDVKEMHFTVFAAEEEYGFEQTGALVVSCRPEELQKLLGRHTGDKSQILKSRLHNFM